MDYGGLDTRLYYSRRLGDGLPGACVGPSRVVVDEMVGVWISLLAAPAGHVWYGLAAFMLFRFFDILKPLGIRRMEKLPGGWGVMMDDILSGVYGFILLIIARWIIG